MNFSREKLDFSDCIKQKVVMIFIVLLPSFIKYILGFTLHLAQCGRYKWKHKFLEGSLVPLIGPRPQNKLGIINLGLVRIQTILNMLHSSK